MKKSLLLLVVALLLCSHPFCSAYDDQIIIATKVQLKNGATSGSSLNCPE